MTFTKEKKLWPTVSNIWVTTNYSHTLSDMHKQTLKTLPPPVTHINRKINSFEPGPITTSDALKCCTSSSLLCKSQILWCSSDKPEKDEVHKVKIFSSSFKTAMKDLTHEWL